MERDDRGGNAMGLLSRMLGKRDPERAQKWIEKGLQAAKSGRLREALDAYERATKADAESAMAHTNVGIALLDLYNNDVGTLDDAEASDRLHAIESVLMRATELEDAPLAAHRALGHCAMRLHHFALAAKSFAAAAAFVDDETPAREELEGLQAEAARLAKRDAVVERAAKAAAFDDVTEEERDAAAQDLVFVLIEDDAPADADWAAGAIARRKGNVAAAREHYETCLGKNPHHDRARRELAKLCMNEGDMKAALEHSLRAYQADPVDAGRVCNVGVCYLALGQRDKAQEFLDLAQELAPTDPIVQRAIETLERDVASKST